MPMVLRPISASERAATRRLDLLLDEEAILEEAVRPVLAIARRRRLLPPTTEAAGALFLAWERIRRERRQVERELSL